MGNAASERDRLCACAIAAGYLTLWRSGARPGEEGLKETPRTGNSGEVPTAREPSSETEPP